MQNQSNSLITFDSQLKTALIIKITIITVNVHVQAASVDKPHPEFRSADFGKKCNTIKFEVRVTFNCYKPTRTNNQGFTIKLKFLRY